jgi:hypothetical protein
MRPHSKPVKSPWNVNKLKFFVCATTNSNVLRLQTRKKQLNLFDVCSPCEGSDPKLSYPPSFRHQDITDAVLLKCGFPLCP